VANGCNENIPALLVFKSSMVYIGLFQEMPMPKPNLSSASVDALLKLRDEIEEVLAHRAALLREELSKLGRQIGSKGKVRGSSLKGRKVAVKYRDRSGNTWAGRGAQPVWLREKLKAGAKLEDFAVHKTAASRKASPKKRRRAKR
jgi:DNA-binding protein H-NS